MKNLARRAVGTGPPAPPESLAAALAEVPDPRRSYGWQRGCEPVPLVALLQATVAAVLGGARSLSAVAQWVRERSEDDPALRAALGFPPGRGTCVATLHRVYKALDVAAFERAVGGWLARTGVAPDDPVALDGKTLRGSRAPGAPAGEAVPGLHLVAAYAHAAGAVLAQVAAPGKGQELAAARVALEAVPLAGRVVTGDALLTQRDLCAQVVAAGGDYVLPVKANQPALRAALEGAFPLMRPSGAAGTGPPALPPWYADELRRKGGAVGAVAVREPKARHGREEVRLLWALADPFVNRFAGSLGTAGTAWPHLAQVARVERRRVVRRRGELRHEIEVGYAITSLPPARADAPALLRYLRGHWGIENKLHWVRDVTFDEDRSQTRTGAAPQAMAACRNLALALLRRRGHANIAAALRTYAARPRDALALVRSGGIV